MVRTECDDAAFQCHKKRDFKSTASYGLLMLCKINITDFREGIPGFPCLFVCLSKDKDVLSHPVKA